MFLASMQRSAQRKPLDVPAASRRIYAQHPCMHAFCMHFGFKSRPQWPHTGASSTSCRQCNVDYRFTDSSLTPPHDENSTLSLPACRRCWVHFQGVLTRRSLLFMQLPTFQQVAQIISLFCPAAAAKGCPQDAPKQRSTNLIEAPLCLQAVPPEPPGALPGSGDPQNRRLPSAADGQVQLRQVWIYPGALLPEQ